MKQRPGRPYSLYEICQLKKSPVSNEQHRRDLLLEPFAEIKTHVATEMTGIENEVAQTEIFSCIGVVRRRALLKNVVHDV